MERAISELVSNAASHVNLVKVPFTQFDTGFLLSWPLVTFRLVNGHLRDNLQCQGQSIPDWTLPEKGWIKINFDGASRGNLGVSGIGVIARDDWGNTLAIGAQRLVDGSNNVAECQATLEAILMAGKLGVKKLHLEGDSQVVVNEIARGRMAVWHLDKQVRGMQLLLGGFEDFKVTHVLREENLELTNFQMWELMAPWKISIVCSRTLEILVLSILNLIRWLIIEK